MPSFSLSAPTYGSTNALSTAYTIKYVPSHREVKIEMNCVLINTGAAETQVVVANVNT
jgi:hypothetical protein